MTEYKLAQFVLGKNNVGEFYCAINLYPKRLEGTSYPPDEHYVVYADSKEATLGKAILKYRNYIYDNNLDIVDNVKWG